jgi:Rad3-related DNA helicase
VPHFRTCAGPTGSGKTYAATTFACERIPRNVKSVFIQPTIALCKQSYVDARARFPDIKDRVRTIVTRRGADDKIAHRITRYLNDRDEAGDLVPRPPSRLPEDPALASCRHLELVRR